MLADCHNFISKKLCKYRNPSIYSIFFYINKTIIPYQVLRQVIFPFYDLFNPYFFGIMIVIRSADQGDLS